MDKVCEEKLQPYIDNSYQELADYVKAYSQKMKMKREVLADKAIWTAKKRYILNVYNSEGVQFEEPQIKIQGLEAIKSSTPAACREKIKTALNIILKGTESELHDFISDFKEEFKTLPIEEISFPRSVNGIKTYGNEKTIWTKGTPIHVRGALVYNHMIEHMKLTKSHQLIQEGEKIKFCYLKEPNVFKTDVISFVNRIPKEFNLNNYIDYNLQFEKSFIDPLTIILEKINWKTEKQNSLEDFFG
jgi:DNA polymerase elongation subunit (family B)